MKGVKTVFLRRVSRIALLLVFAVVSLTGGLLFIEQDPVQAATYTVTTTNEDGAGSLNQAIIDANANPGADQIDFNIAGAGPHRITISSPMARPTEQVTINGLSQSGSVCNGASTELMIELDLNEVGNAFYIPPEASGIEINGLKVFNGPNTNYALWVNADDAVLRCNFFGTVDGETPASSNAADRVDVSGDNVTVGGDAVTDMNLFLPTEQNALTFNSSTNSYVVKNNKFGVTLDGTTAVDSMITRAIYSYGDLTSATISNNQMTAPQSAISLGGGTGTPHSNVTISDNLIGVNADGDTAFSGMQKGLELSERFSDLTVTGNVIATTVDSNSNIQIAGSTGAANNVNISDNKLNVSQDGTANFEALPTNNSGGIALNGGGDNWILADNTIYSGGIAINMGSSYPGIQVTGNSIGMNSAASACFDDAGYGIFVNSSDEVMIGGTDPADANSICVDGYGYSTNSLNTVSLLGNSIKAQSFGAIFINNDGRLDSPDVIGKSESGGDTDFTFTLNAPAGDYRIEFYQNDSRLNGGGQVEMGEFIGYANITSDGSGEQQFTEIISGDGYTYVSATATEIDDSDNGFGQTSQAKESVLETDLEIVTTDGVDEVFQGAEDHVITQTITNLGPTTLTTVNFGITSICFDISTIVESGTATDTGTFDEDYHSPSNSRWTGVLEPGQNLVLTFTGDADCPAVDAIVFANSVIAHVYPSKYNNETVVDNNFDNYDPVDTTTIVGYEAVILETTTDGVDEVTVGTTDHEITQTIYNGGTDSVDTIGFDMSATDCFDLSTVNSSMGSYDDDTNVWIGTLQAAETLTLTFTGDITCDAGETLTFTHETTSMTYDGIVVTDNNTDNYFTDTTEVVPLYADIEIATDDGVNEINPGTTGHEIVQTITNSGPSTVTHIDFSQDSQDCFSISSVSASGTATDVGSYTGDPDWDWDGTLEQGQTLILTFTGDTACGGNNTINFIHTITNMENSGLTVGDSTAENNDYTDDDTDIAIATSDMSVTKMLNNPEDLAAGAELEYTITITNNGPDAMDVSLYTGDNPGQDSLFLDIMPADITFTGWASDDSIACNSYGAGSAGLFGPAMTNHSDHEIVVCSETSGEENMLGNGESISGVMTVTVANDSDLDFTNYVYSGFGLNDPTQALFAGYDGNSDLIDFIQSIDGNFNNFAFSAPVADLRIEKELVEPFAGNEPGETVSYDITVYNDGPMAVDLDLTDPTTGSNMFTDIYPAGDVTFTGSSDGDILCLDLGPGSIAYLQNAGSDHPDHQLVVCGYQGSGLTLASGASRTVRLNFTVNSSPSSSYTNYAAHAAIPTDLDSQIIATMFATSSEDILDSISNENFTKANYLDTSSPGGDNDGVANDVEDSGPNDGDANNDGTPDSEQANVVNLISSITNSPVALEVSDDCSITAASVNAEDSNSETDPEYVYPLGFLGFTIDCGDPGYTAAITAYFYDTEDDNYVLRKYHSDTDAYTTVAEASLAEATVAGSPVITASYQVTDGGELDVDGVADGSITDPVGLGAQTSSILGSTGRSVIQFIVISAVLVVTATGVLWAKRYVANKHDR